MSNDEPKLTIFVSSMIGPLWDERVIVEEAIRTGIPYTHLLAKRYKDGFLQDFVSRVNLDDDQELVITFDRLLSDTSFTGLFIATAHAIPNPVAHHRGGVSGFEQHL